MPTELCLAGRELTSPLISPDASTVAFVSREAGDPSAVRLVSTSGGPERMLDLPDEPHVHVFVARGAVELDAHELRAGDAARLTDHGPTVLTTVDPNTEILVWATA